MISNLLFRYVHGNNLIYNTCWEDPRVDRQALELSPNDTLMMISSAGCNALDYALLGPKKIHCVDMNPRQNALLELKQAAIRALDYEQFFSLFGEGYAASFPDWYRNQLRPQLKIESRDFWDKHQNYFTGSSLRKSFYFRGTSGYVAWVLNHYLKSKRLREGTLELFQSNNIKEQADRYEELKLDSFFSQLFGWASRRQTTMSFLGVPKAQFKQLELNYTGGMAQFIQDSIKAVFTKIPLQDNYFWWLYLNGQYSRNRCPEYLKENNFNVLKGGLVDRIDTHNSSVLAFLQTQEEKTISRFVLLDHMDWMSANAKDTLAAEWQALISRAKPNARFLWRSASLYADFIDPISVNHEGEQIHLGELLRYQRTLARKLHKTDRVHTYGSFYIADLMPL